MNSNETKGIVTKTTNLKNSFQGANHRRKYPNYRTSGGTFSDFELSWLYNGPVLTIVNNVDGMVLSSWNFTSVTGDNQTEISCVIEYPVSEHTGRASKENQLYFFVSYSSRKDANKASYISICHPRTSQILHTLITKEKVTCLSLIASKKEHSSPISGVVKHMSGALAVGTANGNVLIVDIKEMFSCARRNTYDSIPNRSSELMVLDLKHHSENTIREKISKADEHQHIAVSLQVSDRKDIQDYDSAISCMAYVPQCTMLAIGLRSGVFQLWDICSLKKLYKSTQLGIPTPVMKFGFQEPCNDPQCFCYLWVLHESDTNDHSCMPFAVMYACLFKKVASVPDYGSHYKNFMHCKKRFDLDVDMDRCLNGRCVACHVVSNTPSNLLRHVTANEDDPSKINLFVMAFETWEHDTELSSYITLAVFDMNQWYKAQMPHQTYQGDSVPFVNFQLLDRVSDRKRSVLDMQIRKDTIQQFLSFNLSEEYTYPSSLSFDTLFLTESRIVHLRIPGAQRNVIEKIVAEGPTGIICPNKYFSECKEVGLRPCFSDSCSHLIMPSQLQQRNFILTILLEHKMSSFLVRCVKEWVDGSRGVSGCTLPNLIQWAWDCVTRIKQLTDAICIPLFDYSGDDLDRENYQKLKHCCQLMHIIRDLLGFVLKNYRQYLLDDTKVVHQIDTLQLVTKYFDVIIWCLDCSLLPEKVSSSSDKCVPTYMMNLMQYTEQRREELRTIVMKDKYFLTENTTLYIIDSILESEPCGKKMITQWERESSGMTNGLYPPVTLQSLLRMFLMPNLSTDAKNFIMIYFLLDVCDYHRDEDMKEQLLSFSIVFSVDTPFFSLVQACWLVDHEKFEEAANLLLMDSVITQLKNRRQLYRTLMLSCVSQGQYAMSLKCERLASLASSVFKNEKFYLTLLLLNGLVMEAYTTLKTHCFDKKELLRHFFKVCDTLGHLKEIFKFPLTTEEEDVFISYLDERGNGDTDDLKIMYLLSRARYVEAIDVNHKLGSVVPKFGVVGSETTMQKSGVGRTMTRDLLVNAFGKTLPSVTNDLINFCRKEKNKIYRVQQVAKPTPLSVVVHTDTSQQIPMYKSSYESVMQAAISKTAETWTNVPEIFKNRKAAASIKNTPFLRSDIVTPRANKTSSFLRRERTDCERKPDDPDEPPRKRLRTVANTTFDSVSEEKNETPVVASQEVSMILRTPHVQKRLNKLLQSTPEASPLTSILKSSELPRFRQPQKVGFNVPEMERRTSQRVHSGSRTPSPRHDKAVDESHTKKSLLDHSKRSPRENTTRVEEAAPLNESLNTSAANESYYSLDSDNESPNIGDFVQESSLLSTAKKSMIVESMSEEESTEAGSRFKLETMSDESTVPGARHRFIVESMSDEDTFEQPLRTLVEVQTHIEVHAEPAPIEVHAESAEVGVELPDTASPFLISSIRSAPAETAVSDVQPDNVPASTFHGDAPSLASLRPLLMASDTPMKEKSLQTPDLLHLSSQRSRYDESSPALDQSRAFEFGKTTESEPAASFREEFSLDTYEKETMLEPDATTMQTAEPSSETSIVEIHEEDNAKDEESDSDIEIVEDTSMPLPDKATVDDAMDDAATEENDDMSERTYESDYSYSHDSVEAEGSYVEEELASEEEVASDEEVIDDGPEEEDVEEIDEEEEEDDYVNEEKERESADEKAESADTYDQQTFLQNNPDVNYDELKKIMSSVAETEAIIESQQPKEADDFKTPVVKLLFNRGANVSVCEVFDMTPSVIEETVTISSLEATEDRSGPIRTEDGGDKRVFCVDSDDELEGEKPSPSKTPKEADTSVEVLSVSCVDREKASDEPPMVFYFGENSVTSIGEELLNDEQSQPPPVNSKPQDGAKTMEPEPVTAAARDEQAANVEKDDGYEEEGCLTATQPECHGVHRIEKIENTANRFVDFQAKERPEIEDAAYVQLEAAEPLKMEQDMLYVQPEVEWVSVYESTESELQLPMEVNALAGSSGEQPEDLTKHDMVARELTYDQAKEANRLADVGKEKSEKRMCADSLKLLGEEVVSSSFSAVPDAAPLDLVIPANVSACNEGAVDPAAAESTFREVSSAATTSPPAAIVELPRSLLTSPKRTWSPPTTIASPAKHVMDVDITSPVKSASPAASVPSQRRTSPRIAATPERLDSTLLAHAPSAVTSNRADSVGSPSRSPASKADSVCSLTFSVPDSPGPHEQPLEPICTPPQRGSPSVDPALTGSRRSARIARRRSVDSIPDAVIADPPTVGKSRASRKRNTVRVAEAAAATTAGEPNDDDDDDDDDDAMSIRSGLSVADSVVSRASSVSSSRSVASSKRSYSRLELRKSSARLSHRPLEVIPSDDETASPGKSLAASSGRSSVSRRPKYAASEPGSYRTRATKSKSTNYDDSSDDDRLSLASAAADGAERKRRPKRSRLNTGMLRTPSPSSKPPKRLICSTPMTTQKVELERSKSTSEVRDYTNSRRLTRFQKSLLECGIKRLGKSDQVPGGGDQLDDIQEAAEEYSGSEVDARDDAMAIEPQPEPMKRPSAKTRAAGSRQPKPEPASTSGAAAKRHSRRQTSAATYAAPTKSDSSDESISSKASSCSRRSSYRPSYTKVSLRKTSVRPTFKEMRVLSDDEATPSPRKAAADDESVLSSADSSHSKRSQSQRMTRSRVAELEHSDRESSVSDVSNISSSVMTRRARRSLALDEVPPMKAQSEKRQAASPATSEKMAGRRAAKSQKMEEAEEKVPERSSRRRK